MKNRKKLILCVIGMPGAGKTTVMEIIKKKFSACSFETGDVIRDEIRRRGLRYTKENDENVSKWFHAGRERLIIFRTVKKTKSCNRKIIVVSGFFAPEEYSMLSKTGRTVLIAVAASFRKRYRRELLRKRFSNQTMDYLKRRDRRELREGLGKLMEKADYRIINNSGKRGLEKKAVAVVERILKNSGKH